MSFGSIVLVVFMLHVNRSERGFDVPGVGGSGDRCWLAASRLSLVGLHAHHHSNAVTHTPRHTAYTMGHSVHPHG